MIENGKSKIAIEGIASMPAGRELDALIAEHVMGEKVVWIECAWANPQAPAGTPFNRGKLPFHADEEQDEIPNYSTNPSDAFRAAAKLSDRFYLKLRSADKTIPGDSWWAGFVEHGTTGWNGRGDFEAPGNEVALAICRATLMTAFGRKAE